MQACTAHLYSTPAGMQGSELAVYRPQRLRPSRYACSKHIAIETAAVATASVPENSDPTAQPKLRSLATSAIGMAALSLVPDQLGRSKRGPSPIDMYSMYTAHGSSHTVQPVVSC